MRSAGVHVLRNNARRRLLQPSHRPAQPSPAPALPCSALPKAPGRRLALGKGNPGRFFCWKQQNCSEDQEEAVPPRPPPRSKPGAAVGVGPRGPAAVADSEARRQERRNQHPWSPPPPSLPSAAAAAAATASRSPKWGLLHKHQHPPRAQRPGSAIPGHSAVCWRGHGSHASQRARPMGTALWHAPCQQHPAASPSPALPASTTTASKRFLRVLKHLFLLLANLPALLCF